MKSEFFGPFSVNLKIFLNVLDKNTVDDKLKISVDEYEVLKTMKLDYFFCIQNIVLKILNLVSDVMNSSTSVLFQKNIFEYSKSSFRQESTDWERAVSPFTGKLIYLRRCRKVSQRIHENM